MSHPFGQNLIGAIWTLSSDGDSSFRRARHIICMVRPIDLKSAFGEKLDGLKGLNLLTSEEGIVGSCDPKHIFKRMCSRLLLIFKS